MRGDREDEMMVGIVERGVVWDKCEREMGERRVKGGEEIRMKMEKGELVGMVGEWGWGKSRGLWMWKRRWWVLLGRG